MPKSVRDLFSSKWGFILAAAGSAIGMGNIWLFPYRVGELGGATFLIPYIICVVVLGFIAVVGEITFGRLTGKGPLGAFQKALRMIGGHNKAGELIGWVSIVVIFFLSLGYNVVVSWVLKFLLASVTGFAFSAFDSAQYFALVTNSHVMLWIIITLFLVGFVMIRGIEKGIESANKFMIPAFLLLFLLLVIRVAFLPGAWGGYKFLFMPRWEMLVNTRTWVLALGQTFYCLSIFGSIMLVYGSYAKKSEDIIFSARNVVVLNTVASIVASLVIIPAVFAFGKDLNSGPALMFVTMPDIFKTMPFGQICMIAFFVAVFFAAITSVISILEVLVESLQHKLKISRWLAVTITIVVSAVCSIAANGHIDGFMDILQIHFVPLCALTSGIFVFWVLPSKRVIEEVQSGRSKLIGKWFIPMGRYVFCSLVIIIYIFNLLHIG